MRREAHQARWASIRSEFSRFLTAKHARIRLAFRLVAMGGHGDVDVRLIRVRLSRAGQKAGLTQYRRLSAGVWLSNAWSRLMPYPTL